MLSPKTITVPTTLTEIGPHNFPKTGSIHLKIEAHVKKIYPSTFVRWPYLKDVELPENIKVLPEGLFNDCYLLQHINLEHVRVLEAGVFKDCRRLTNIELSPEIVKIGQHAFHNCHELKEINFSKTLQEIGAYAFENTSIKHITIPKSIKVIPKGVFQNCRCLETIEILGVIETIEPLAFAGCSSLKEINVSNGTIKQIDHTAFDKQTRKTITGFDIESALCEVISTHNDLTDSIDTLNIQPSSINRLLECNINTIGELLKFSRESLIESNIAGTQGTDHIEIALAEKNLQLKDADIYGHLLRIGNPSSQKPDTEQVSAWLYDIGLQKLNNFDVLTKLDACFLFETDDMFDKLIKLRQNYATVCSFAIKCKTLNSHTSQMKQRELYDEIVKRIKQHF